MAAAARHRRVLLLLAFASLVPSEALPGGDLFPCGARVPLAFPGSAVLAGDLNGDGYPDLVVALEQRGEVSVLVNDGASPSGFSPPVTYVVGRSPVLLLSGDIDADGRIDVLAVNSGSATVSLLRNVGAGRLERLADVQVPGAQPRAARLADVDRDGDLDLIVSSLQTHDAHVFLGEGTGIFSHRETVAVGEKPHSLELADFDSDGPVDLAIPVFEDATGQGEVYFFSGRGDGTFAERREVRVGDARALRFSAAGDFNGDERPDLSVVDLGGTVFVLVNRGNWEFDVGQSSDEEHDGQFRVVTEAGDGFLYPVDWEGDGDTDLVTRVERHGEAGFRIYRNGGAGTFSASADALVDSSMRSLALADLDRDGLLDGVATWTTPEVVVFQGKAPGKLDLRTSLPLDTLPRGIAVFGAGDGGASGLVAHGSSSVHVVTGVSEAVAPSIRSLEFPECSFQDGIAADLDGVPGDEAALVDLVAGEVLILLGLAGGDALRTVRHKVGDFPRSLAVGDFDADGIRDVAVAHEVSPFVRVLMRPGVTGVPEGVDVPVGGGQIAIASGDVTADGAEDLLVSAGATTWLFVGGEGRFSEHRVLHGELEARSISLADLDSDSVPEVLLVGERDLVILYGGGGGKTPVIAIPLGFVAHSVAVGDLDGDGRRDLALAAQDRNAVAIFRSLVANEFAPAEFYGVGISPKDIALADLNGDGRLDAATADFGSRSLSILTGRRGGDDSFRRGDPDFDGDARVTDAIVILRALFLGGEPISCSDAADANDDGHLNLSDAVYLLRYLFLGGDSLPLPGPRGCGQDPTEDALPVCTGSCI